jgi:hypothetical protein
MLLGQLDQILKAGNITMTKIADQYTSGIYTWLPIISPGYLDQVRNVARGEHAPLGTVLVALALCLATFHLPQQPNGLVESDVKELYIRVKMMLTQAELLLGRSSDAIQAGILVTVHEYGSGNFSSAYESVGKLTRAWHVLSMGQRTETNGNVDESIERRTTLWCLMILERQASSLARYPVGTDSMARHVLLEINDGVQLAVNKLPAVETDHARVFGQSGENGHDSSRDPGGGLVDGFGRLQQATSWLDCVFTALKLEKASRVPALQHLNDKVRQLLDITMGEYRGPGCLCGANATLLR